MKTAEKEILTKFQYLKAPEIWSKYTTNMAVKVVNELQLHQLVKSIQPILVNTDVFVSKWFCSLPGTT